MRAYLLLLLGLLGSHSATAQPGLRATFYRGKDFSGAPLLTRTDPTIDFNWDYDAPAPGLPQENYCVRWTGALRAPQTGTYTFHITTDDGMRVWLGNQQLFDEWRPQTPSGFSARIRLTAGEYYPLRVEYYQLGYQGQARLTWEPPTPDRAQARNLFGLLKTEPEPISPRFLVARVPPPPVAAPSATSPAPRPVPPTPAVAVSPRARVPPTSTPPATPQPVVRATPPPTPARPQPTPTPAAVPAQPTTADLGTLAKGTTLEVQNLYFEQSRAVLLPTSEPAIAQLAAALTRYPRMALEIAGHTENIGEPAANQRLAEQRARHIRALLIARGVDSTRLTAVGYGGTRPVINSPEPLKRARNRRVEVIVR